MATRASAEVTVTDRTDATAVRAWYRTQVSSVAPSAPNTSSASATPSGWTLAEPTVSGSADLSNYVWRCEQLVWGDGTCDWGPVTLSSSYEAAKVAYNEAQAAKATATSFITELGDGVMVHPDGDATTGWSIRDALELLKGGVSMLRAWVDGQIVKMRIGLADLGHVTLESDGMYVWRGGEIVAGMQRKEEDDEAELFVGNGAGETVGWVGSIWFEHPTTGTCGPVWALCGDYPRDNDHYELYETDCPTGCTNAMGCAPTARFGTYDRRRNVTLPFTGLVADEGYYLNGDDGTPRLVVYVAHLGSSSERIGLSNDSYVVSRWDDASEYDEISVWGRIGSAQGLSDVSSASKYAGRRFRDDYWLSPQSYTLPLDGLRFSVGPRSLDMRVFDRPFYPTFVYSAFPTYNGAKDETQLPVTPCFVLDLSDGAYYFCDGS